MRVARCSSQWWAPCAKELLAGSYIQADETPVDVQTHDKRGKNHQAYLWQYGTTGRGDDRSIFRMSRRPRRPGAVSGSVRGNSVKPMINIAYERGIGWTRRWCTRPAGLIAAESALWMPVKLNRQDAASIRAVKLMDELFAIDREASEVQMDHAARGIGCARRKLRLLLDPDPGTHPGNQQDGVARERG